MPRGLSALLGFVILLATTAVCGVTRIVAADPTSLGSAIAADLPAVGLVFGVLLLSLALHEGGHALAILAVGRRVARIELGHGTRLVTLPAGSFRLTVHAGLLRGARTYWPGDTVGFPRRLVVTAAGPLTNVLIGVVAVIERQALGDVRAAAVIGCSLSMVATNLIPSPTGVAPANDARVLVTLLRQRPSAGALGRAKVAALVAQAGEGDPSGLLDFSSALAARSAPGFRQRLAASRLQGLGLEAAGRFAEAVQTGAADPSPTMAIVQADRRVCAALFGQSTLAADDLRDVVAVIEQALAGILRRAQVNQVNQHDRSSLAHSLAVGRLLQGRPADAVALLGQVRREPLTRLEKAAVDATRAIAFARTDHVGEARQILTDLRLGSPWSPWVPVLSAELDSRIPTT